MSPSLPVLILLTVSMGGAWAEERAALPEAVTLPKLLEIVREQSPRYAALRQRLEAARAEVVAAGVLPNPRFSYNRYDLLTRNNTMYDGYVQQNITLEVPVLMAGQRGARVEAAEKQLAAAEAGIEAEFADLVVDVWRLYVKLLAERQRIAHLEENSRYLDRLSAIVAGRERAGNASRYDLLRIDIEDQSLKTRLDMASGDLVATGGELGVLLGLSGWKPSAQGELAPLGIPHNGKRLLDEAERLNPEIEAARRGEAAADAGLERARRERWPVPSFQLGSAFTDKPYGNTSFAGVSVDLPLFDRGQGGMARAAADKQAALLQRELATRQTRAALDRALELLVRRRETLLKFEREVVAKLGDLQAMAEASYRLGQGTLLELLDASRSRTETRLTHVELIQAEVEAELDVLRASGLLVSAAEAGFAK